MSNQDLTEAQFKYRAIGALFWLLLVGVWGSKWYSDPVNFQPEAQQASAEHGSKGGQTVFSESDKRMVVADHAYRLPSGDTAKPLEKSHRRPLVPSNPSFEKAQSAKAVQPHKKSQVPDPLSVSSSANPQYTAIEQSNRAGKSSKSPTKPVATNKPHEVDKAEDVLADDLMTAKGWFLQLAAFKKLSAANELLGRVEEIGYEGYVKPIRKHQFFVVVIGPFKSEQQAKRVKKIVDKRLYVNARVFKRL